MSPFTVTLIEWSATLLSLVGFWLCIRHRAVCFLFFLVADAGWFASAFAGGHASLLAQQSIYILMNVVGYFLWKRDERLKELLEAAEKRALQPSQKPAPAPALPAEATR
ncbi:Nicotinamide mononucleotide transporter [Verrucomicrobium sp. GAS474]|uniref:nicotinamide mononucleotide transporter n=1 Tax=Verrucomicrobium sp. GAS474 TaxID=1882831 RepID=UPI00087B0EB3|nr:nicotinamide mononucleotide transporter [Verrucomicrobium sp. GAS474]SDT89311.1 Nicotinamide mononucleotide transporter [Verrucomicrobium sp. GAS474]